MRLYEPITLTWVLISLLALAVSWFMGDDLYTKAQRDCQERNVQHVKAHEQEEHCP